MKWAPLLGWLVTAACAREPTQPAVVIRDLSGGGGACDDALPNADPFDAATARARCDHPDMLVHPRCYVLVRVPAPRGAHIYALDQATPSDRCDFGGTTSARIATYCVDPAGKATLVDGSAPPCR